MPTGGGKSICFQVPALSRKGICIVISPLISLMKDQVEHLNAIGIRAIAVYSGMSFKQIDIALDNAVYGDFKFLYVSPERLGTDIFRTRLSKMHVNFLVVDEAHCISQWGYDFRPAYLEIAEVRKILGMEVPVIALTASATERVADDIEEKLGFSKKNIISAGFERKNLSYVVRKAEDKNGQLLRICRGIKGSGIVYVRERKRCSLICSFLKEEGISADYYHAGLSRENRDLRQENWMNGISRIMVATNAFGMGIDKPDVRFVVHMDIPDSMESYYQEAGRGGRDGIRAYAVLLWNDRDIRKLRQIRNVNYPPVEFIKKVYQQVFTFLDIPYEGGRDSVNKFNLPEFCRYARLNQAAAYYAIKYIEQEGYWELTDELDNPSRIKFTVSREELYSFQLSDRRGDSFIKALLRMYTGIFTQFSSIDEDYMARVMRDSPENIKAHLISLSRKHIIKYIPRKRSPLIIMHAERLVPENFYISEKTYLERKNLLGGRIEAMIDFVKNESECRSIKILRYFGQKNTDKCGICDVCLAEKRRGDTENEEKTEQKILEFVKKETGKGRKVNISDIQMIGGEEYKYYISILRKLADDNKVVISGNNISVI
jgi:ATP-dependent DNA helicase RecQ